MSKIQKYVLRPAKVVHGRLPAVAEALVTATAASDTLSVITPAAATLDFGPLLNRRIVRNPCRGVDAGGRGERLRAKPKLCE